MGYGAYVTINNPSSQTFTTQVSNVSCMYDDGDQGSNPSELGGQTILANSSFGPQYVEAKASGGCFFDASTFNISFIDGSGNLIATVACVEKGGIWAAGSDTHNASAGASQGKQATITVKLTPS